MKITLVRGNNTIVQYNCNIHIVEIEPKEDKNLILEKNKEFNLVIDYPIEIPVHFKFKTKNGMTFNQLINKIKNYYELIYKKPKKYKIWGHVIDDLWIEKININETLNTITLFIGS